MPGDPAAFDAFWASDARRGLVGLEQLLPARQQPLQLLARARWAASMSTFVQSSASRRSSSATSASRPAISASTRSSSVGPPPRRPGRLRLLLREPASGSAAFGASARSARTRSSRPSRRRTSGSSRPRSRASARATASSSARSCETSSTVPGKSSSAASSASRLSRSRWFVGSSRTRKFAPDATTMREREPPPLAAREHGRPASRARPSRRRGSGRAAFCACGRVSPVAAWVQSRTVLALGRARSRAARSTPGSTPWPSRERPVLRRSRGRAASRGASSCPLRSAPRARRARRARARTRRRSSRCLSPVREREPFRLDHDRGRCAAA